MTTTDNSQVRVVGYSIGAYLAQWAQYRYPDHVVPTALHLACVAMSPDPNPCRTNPWPEPDV